MNVEDYKTLNDSLKSFQLIKKESEAYWKTVSLKSCWGYQTQTDSKWKPGLNEEQLLDFQQQLGIKFSEGLKNYYRTMNGLDKPAVNVFNYEEEPEYRSTFYSYPNDIDLIKEMINWVKEANTVSNEQYAENNFPKVFPYYIHRFLILNKDQLVLSMHGSDIIHWAENLSKGLAIDIFESQSYYKFNNQHLTENDFWCGKVS